MRIHVVIDDRNRTLSRMKFLRFELKIVFTIQKTFEVFHVKLPDSGPHKISFQRDKVTFVFLELLT